MSSVVVREKIMNFLTTNFPSEKFVDMSVDYRELSEILEEYNIARRDSWVGVQFVGSDEQHMVLGSKEKGTYRELGAVYLHIVAPAQLGVANILLPRIESYRNAFRGQRIDSLVVEKTTPPDFGSGTLQFEDGFLSGTTAIHYYNDLNI